MSSAEHAARVKARALTLGFHRVGITSVEPLTVDHERYLAFVAEGRHGAMDWLADNQEARRGMAHPGILTHARSVIVCAMAYHRAGDERTVPGATIARYARGRDYHNFMRRRLRRLATWLRAEYSADARPMVDTAPVLERAWARRAGVGFVGKNGCVIAPGLGSYILLGEVATSIELASDAPIAERCGACRLCLDACPTQAFTSPYTLDPRRCVSYLTIEQQGSIPVELRAAVGNRLFGCDDCQDVCPYNHVRAPDAHGTRDFAALPRWQETALESLVGLDAAGFDALTAGTALGRAGRVGLARNAAVVMGNTGGRRHLPVLRHAAESDPSDVVRETALWAIGRVVSREG